MIFLSDSYNREHMKKFFLVSLAAIALTVFADSSPVVQIISYKEPLGMYFSLQ